MADIIVNSPAKVNLFLKIVGKLDDVFHDLESVFTYIELHDKIRFSYSAIHSKSPKISLNVTGDQKNYIDPKKNIFTEIFSFFVKNYKINHDIKIDITKNIPIGAGLGGGSSNGVCLIKFINDKFHLSLTKDKMQEISFNFGSDLAFFFEEKASIIRKRGLVSDNLIKFEPIDILLINPQIHLSTKDVFANFNQNFSNKTTNKEILEQDPISLAKNYPNQLQEVSQIIAPEIAKLLDFLKKQKPIAVKMTGSGSTCFAIFDNKALLDKAFENCLREFPNYFIKKTKIIYSL